MGQVPPQKSRWEKLEDLENAREAVSERKRRVQKYRKICILSASVLMAIIVVSLCFFVTEIRLKRDVDSSEASWVLVLPWWVLPVDVPFVWIAVILLLELWFGYCSNYDHQLQRMDSRKREIIMEVMASDSYHTATHTLAHFDSQGVYRTTIYS